MRASLGAAFLPAFAFENPDKLPDPFIYERKNLLSYFHIEQLNTDAIFSQDVTSMVKF